MWLKVSKSSNVACDQIQGHFPIPSSVSLQVYFPSDTDFHNDSHPSYASRQDLSCQTESIKMPSNIKFKLLCSIQDPKKKKKTEILKGQSFAVTGERYPMTRSAGRTQCPKQRLLGDVTGTPLGSNIW